MKITKLLMVMALAGSSLNQASAQSTYVNAPTPAARHIGDGVKSVGDTNRYVELPEDNRPEEFKPMASLVSNSEMMDMSMIAPSAASEYTSGYTSCGTGKCGSALISGCGNSATEWWVNMDALLWFGQKRQMPTVLTTADPGILPVLGNPGVTSAFGGGDGLKSGILPGYRLSGGKYIDDCQKIGIGGQVFGIFQSTKTANAPANANQSVGIPFYNDFIDAEDAFLVNFNNGVPVITGTATARADLNMIGAEASVYTLLGRSRDHRIDLVSGYTFNRLNDSVTVVSDSLGFVFPINRQITTNDLFENENVFHGAHLGMLSSVVHQRITLSTLAKVSFGNMHQTSSIRGFQTDTFGGVTTTTPGGVLTQQSNITNADFERNAFAFIPQMNLKMGYALNDCLQLNVGYSFMYWSNVGLAGNQIDRVIDITQASGGPLSNRPQFGFAESGFWMQGIDLGLTATF